MSAIRRIVDLHRVCESCEFTNLLNHEHVMEEFLPLDPSEYESEITCQECEVPLALDPRQLAQALEALSPAEKQLLDEYLTFKREAGSSVLSGRASETPFGVLGVVEVPRPAVRNLKTGATVARSPEKTPAFLLADSFVTEACPEAITPSQYSSLPGKRWLAKTPEGRLLPFARRLDPGAFGERLPLSMPEGLYESVVEDLKAEGSSTLLGLGRFVRGQAAQLGGSEEGAILAFEWLKPSELRRDDG